jgi:NAD-dependent dihydropyrimidine dehydrogenase PreA subunit
MRRKIIKIDESRCNGCGQCVPSCKEGALRVIGGKARLVSEVYCDGLGACLGKCPMDAISVEEREAEEFDEKGVERYHAAMSDVAAIAHGHGGGCPGSVHRVLAPATQAHAHHGGGCPGSAHRTLAPAAPNADASQAPSAGSCLGHWPVQLNLVSPRAPFLAGADLLVCADCVPFAVPDFHQRYLAGRAVVVGCPKLDDLEHYREKLREMLAQAKPRSVTVLRMEVPCCGGLAMAVAEARERALPGVPLEVHTVGVDGSISIERK